MILTLQQQNSNGSGISNTLENPEIKSGMNILQFHLSSMNLHFITDCGKNPLLSPLSSLFVANVL